MLSKILVRLFKMKRELMKRRFSRVLPANELFTDRWEKAAYLNFGKGTSAYDSCLIFGDVKVGNNTWIGPFSILDGTGGLTIGSSCSISAGVHIYSHDTVRWAVSGGKEPYEYAAVVIEDNCYIGPNTVISRGVTIGKGTVVGCNSFVNQSWPPNSKIAGTPAKQLS